MIPFLKSIALAYVSRYADLSEMCFLFPNKRSGTFFLKFLKEECGRKLTLAPEVMTISEFVGMLSEKAVASRLDQLFLLYEAYREMLGLPAAMNDACDDGGVDFDSFWGWGETVLSDFSEVDQYLASPEEIFKNVKDYREISSNFLTEEQKEVMAEYFGRTDIGDPSKFWKNFDGEEERLSEVKRRFLHLWRIMWPLYQKLNDKLSERGLATTGGAYRLALENLKTSGRDYLPYKKVVAVGFNALSAAENGIFAELRDFEGYEGFDSFGDFFWDATGPVLTAGANSASKFVKANIKMFPAPEWAMPALKLSDNENMPRLRVAGSPSNSAQVKIAGTMLAELRGRLTSDEITGAKVAVVLPDENLLLPMLYSLPDGMGDVNLTMGYPLRLTSVVPFMSMLRKLHYNKHTVKGDMAFYHRDVRLFLSHPFSHAIFGSNAIGKVFGYLDRHHKAMITLDEIRDISEKMALLLDASAIMATPKGVLQYMDSVLESVSEALPGMEGAMVKTRLEIGHIDVYRDSLRRLADILDEYACDMRPSTVFFLADKLLAGEKVGFEGEPLTGLQVMGTLETRSIDFDYIFILSMNERVMPRRARTKTFIPDSLRHAFGMPPSNYAESIFAYYFYRMISRAKEVTMIYDARSGAGLAGGDVSRYILQLRHLFAKDIMDEQDWKFVLTGKTPYDPSVEKNDEIKEVISLFMKEGGKNFSASSLNSYRECQVRFFYQNVLGISTDPEPSEYIDAITGGNILHDMMLSLYLQEEKRKKYLEEAVLMTSDKISGMLADSDRLWQLTTRTVNKLHFNMRDEELDTPLSGAAKIVGARIMEQVQRVLRHDLRLAPFKIYGCEIEETLRIKLPSGRDVNFKFAIDRLDEVKIDGEWRLRIVDYKTGKIKLSADTLEEVMAGDYRSEQIFQLFTYAWLLTKRGGDRGEIHVRTEIYDVPGMLKMKESLPEIGKEIIYDYYECAGYFSKEIEAMIDGVFDNPRFEATADEGRCMMCGLKRLCRR